MSFSQPASVAVTSSRTSAAEAVAELWRLLHEARQVEREKETQQSEQALTAVEQQAALAQDKARALQASAWLQFGLGAGQALVQGAAAWCRGGHGNLAAEARPTSEASPPPTPGVDHWQAALRTIETGREVATMADNAFGFQAAARTSEAQQAEARAHQQLAEARRDKAAGTGRDLEEALSAAGQAFRELSQVKP